MLSPNKLSISFLFSLFIFLLSCQDRSTSLPPIEEKDPHILYSYFVAGHVYGNPNSIQLGVHPPLKEKFKWMEQDSTLSFGFFTGDFVPYSTKEYWDALEADIDTLGLEIYLVAGNHETREMFEARFGESYYHFKKEGDLFIVLDPFLDEWNISGDQLTYLKEVIAEEGAESNHIFVFFHQLLWWKSDNLFQNILPNSLQGRADEINFWSEIEPLFKDLEQEVVMFAGDMGVYKDRESYMYYKNENITLIGSGMGSGIKDNIVIVDILSDKTLQYRLIALNGEDINALGKLEEYVVE